MSGQDDIVRLASQINASSIANIEASVASDKLTITNSAGKDITISGTGTILTDIGLPAGTYSNWSNASFTPSASAPTGATPNGRLWYDSRSTTIDLVEVFDAGSTTAGELILQVQLLRAHKDHQHQVQTIFGLILPS